MKPLDELRSISDGCAYNEDDCRQWRSCREHRAQLLDAIETEIAERYVMLPKDADGVPIHVGDRVMHKSLVKPVVAVGVGNDDFFYQNGAGFNWFFHAHEVRHHKQDTWESIINDTFGSIEMNDDVRAVLVARCKALAGEDE